MKNLLVVLCLVMSSFSCLSQTTDQLERCKASMDKDIDISLVPEICSEIFRKLPSGLDVTHVWDDGSFLTADGLIHAGNLPARLASALRLDSARVTYQKTEEMLKSTAPGDAYGAPLLSDYRENIWPAFRAEFCRTHRGEAYTDLSNAEVFCNGMAHGVTGHSMVNSVPTAASLPSSSRGTRTCQRAITFAYARDGNLTYKLPDEPQKWLVKLQDKYPNVCFLQNSAIDGLQNYLVVLSSSSSAYDGLQPVLRRNTTTAPISGSGAVTDNTGGTWSFTYWGTVTTTTRSESNIGYTDTTVGFFANAYREDGSLAATSERTETSRQGGDPYNALGYNLTSALLAIHSKEHLLESIVKKVNAPR